MVTHPTTTLPRYEIPDFRASDSADEAEVEESVKSRGLGDFRPPLGCQGVHLDPGRVILPPKGSKDRGCLCACGPIPRRGAL